ncbi:MAG: radical SAM protein [Thermodesulfobacteriota bacterium]|nr:radical SAM protein [Thermodesulfobacteriota bacterium]
MDFKPAYLSLYEKGELNVRKDKLIKILESCILCPRKCMASRLNGKIGFCGAGKDIEISSAFPHFGEERPLIGRGGSGTIFLTHCNLRCVFCQNYDISHLGEGKIINPFKMAETMIFLQQMGCHNINFVTPTHYIPQIIESLIHAIKMGLRVPLVYNCGGYESIETVKLLDGIFDIYMPDTKFSSSDISQKYCNTIDYYQNLQWILKEMHRQVGDLEIDIDGIAQRGMLIRHLVMPNNEAGSKEILEFIAKEISVHSYVNIMDQYRPVFKAKEFPEINRRPAMEEYLNVIDMAKSLGLYRGF